MIKKNLPIYLINQKKRPERLISAINELSKVGLSEYIIRKEGCSPERAKTRKYDFLTECVVENIENRIFSCGLHPTWGSVGCAISHMELWNNMIENNVRYALIVEDNIKIFDADKFLWSYNSGLKLIKKTDVKPTLVSLFSFTHFENRKYIDYNYYVPKEYFTGLSCYFINVQAAKELLKKITYIRLQIDLEVADVFLNRNIFSRFTIYIYDETGMMENKNFVSDVQYYFIEVEEIQKLFNLPYEIADRIHYFLPDKANVVKSNFISV